MTRRSKLWRVFALVFTLVNAGGAVFAAANGEGFHAAVHVGLLLGMYLVWQLAPRAGRQEPSSVYPVEDHLEQLEQSVNAIALELERVGEAQRFMVKVQQERVETQG